MKPIIDVYIKGNGFLVIFLRFIRIGIFFQNEQVVFDLGVYKLGITIGLINAKESLCQEIE